MFTCFITAHYILEMEKVTQGGYITTWLHKFWYQDTYQDGKKTNAHQRGVTHSQQYWSYIKVSVAVCFGACAQPGSSRANIHLQACALRWEQGITTRGSAWKAVLQRANRNKSWSNTYGQQEAQSCLVMQTLQTKNPIQVLRKCTKRASLRIIKTSSRQLCFVSLRFYANTLHIRQSSW